MVLLSYISLQHCWQFDGSSIPCMDFHHTSQLLDSNINLTFIFTLWDINPKLSLFSVV